MKNLPQEKVSLQRSPAKYFRFVVREIRERLKLCEMISVNMEDLAEIESAFGKCLVKVLKDRNIVSITTEIPCRLDSKSTLDIQSVVVVSTVRPVFLLLGIMFL